MMQLLQCCSSKQRGLRRVADRTERAHLLDSLRGETEWQSQAHEL